MYYEIAIPSYSRSSIIGEKSLALLQNSNVPKSQIKIFLKDEEQKSSYIASIGNDYEYVLTGCNGILETRNFLRTYYREQTKVDNILYIDDDITKFQKMCVDVEDFDATIKYMFTTMAEKKLNLGAPSAYNNHFFMRDDVSTNLKYCIGAFQLEIIDREKYEIHTDVGHGEDFQFTMEYFLRDGGVCRFNAYNIVTKYFELTGGICGQLGGMAERQKEMEINMQYLVDRYSPMCRLKRKKWGADLSLNWNFKNS